ncbi:MAG: AAA family ATPase [Pseudacidovorax sp.]|nr:AAA family ATPase [Pseudacidovorax sp.]
MVLSRDPFIGRAASLQALDALALDAPLVTVSGPGGVGKTRLVLEWLHAADATAPARTVLVRLDGLDDAAAVYGAVAAAIDMPRTGGQPYVEAMVQWLHDTPLRLVLDNCEHVADTVTTLVQALLDGTRGVTVVATSRSPLGVAGEAHLRLAPLDEAGALELFVARALQRVPGFVPEGPSLAAIQAICRAVDGLPLAIELAAGWVAVLPAPDLAAQLAQGLALLQRRGALPARHATLADTMQWSHQLLSPAAQLLLQRLSAFPASFAVEALGPVSATGALAPDGILLALRELVEQSLVQFDLPSGRYRLLNTVRLFATALAQKAGEWDAVRDAHAAHFAALALQGRAVDFVPEDQWLPRLQAEVDNLHATLRTLLDAGRGTEALQLATALTTFWWTAGRHREGLGWVRAALAQAEAAPALLRAAAQFSLGFLGAHDTGDWILAAAELDQGLALLAQQQDDGADLLRGYLLCLRGECDNMASAPQAGLAQALEGAALIARHPQDRWGRGFAAWNVGFGHECAGDLPQAALRYAEVIASQRDNSLVVRMIGCQSLAGVLERQGRAAEAMPLFDEALQLCRQVGLLRLGDVHGSLARLLADCARVRVAADAEPDPARALAQEALVTAQALQDSAAATVAADVLARLAGPSRRQGVFRRQGSVWCLGLDEAEAMLPDSKGLRQLRHLLQVPGTEVAATELAAAADDMPREIGRGDAALDPKAIAQYRKRLRLLDEALALPADALDDAQREQVRQEHAFVSQELARSVGLGGRARRTGSANERMRVNVTRTLRAAIAEIEAAHPALGAHLAQSVRTGNFCRYHAAEDLRWQF